MYTTYLTLHEAMINKNKEPFPFDRAEVKFYSFAADESFSLPEIDALLGKESVSEIRNELKYVIARMIDTMMWESAIIRGVRKNHIFRLGDTGKIVFKHEGEAPVSEINWLLTAVEIDRDIRNLGGRVEEIMTNETIDTLSRSIAAIAGVAVGPTALAAVEISKYVVRSIARFMEDNGNDQLGLVEQSFIRELHFPYGQRYVENNQDISRNMWYTYSIATIES